MSERYGFKIAAEGQKSLEILDKTFNEQTKYFLDKHGLSAGMHVLDIGCGLGHMTQYLADKVGETGSVLAIDNNADQLKAAIKLCPDNLKKRIKWLQADIYELDKLGQQFDLIYCRFVLHHIHKPRFALAQIVKVLKDKGLYIGIEGIVNYAFSLPNHPGWQTPMLPIDVQEGETRNANLGKILTNLIHETSLQCIAAEIFQPILLKKEIRELLLQELLDSKESEIYNGNITSYDWERKFNTIKMCVEDPSIIIGFYAGNFVAARKL